MKQHREDGKIPVKNSKVNLKSGDLPNYIERRLKEAPSLPGWVSSPHNS
jgi:hypothetical protein